MQKNNNKSDIGKLIAPAIAGDDKAMESIIETVQADLYRFCIYLCGDLDIAGDICQETLIKVLTKLKTLKDHTKFNSWLFRTAKNIYFDYLKSPRVAKAQILDEAIPSNEGGILPEEILTITNTLQNMNEQDRLLLVLVDQNGYSYSEAAEIIGISEAALTSRIHRARADFLEKYEKS